MLQKWCVMCQHECNQKKAEIKIMFTTKSLLNILSIVQYALSNFFYVFHASMYRDGLMQELQYS